MDKPENTVEPLMDKDSFSGNGPSDSNNQKPLDMTESISRGVKRPLADDTHGDCEASEKDKTGETSFNRMDSPANHSVASSFKVSPSNTCSGLADESATCTSFVKRQAFEKISTESFDSIAAATTEPNAESGDCLNSNDQGVIEPVTTETDALVDHTAEHDKMHGTTSTRSTSLFSDSGESSPRSQHIQDNINEDDYQSDNEPLPPVPQAPRHPAATQNAHAEFSITESDAAQDNEDSVSYSTPAARCSIITIDTAAAYPTLSPVPVIISNGADSPRRDSNISIEEGELYEDAELSNATGNESADRPNALLLTGVSSRPNPRSTTSLNQDSGQNSTADLCASSRSAVENTVVASESTSLSKKREPDTLQAPADQNSGHSASAVRYSNTGGDGNQFVPNSPFSVIADGSSKSPDVRSQTSRDHSYDPNRFTGCSPHTDYEFQKKIGEGTFGEVTIGQHKASKAIVALKKILIHNDKEGMPITALREIKILKSLSHDNVITLREMAYKAGDKGKRGRGTMFMVFPYMDHDLTGLLENPQVRFTPSQIKSYLHQLLLGVEYMHRNKILHRDMKGSNILVDNSGHLKIADFGLARAYVENDTKGYTNMVVTRWYRPPELLMGATRYNGQIDIWGVGCVFGEMLKRRPILTGADDMDQLERIFILCGTPNETTWPGYRKLPIFDPNTGTITSFRNEHKRSIHEKFPSNHFAPSTVNLLDQFLMLDPNKRPTASKALEHDYFFMPPKAAVPGTSDFQSWPTSHELASRLAKEEAAAKARLIEGTGMRSQATHLQHHFDATLVADLQNRRHGNSGQNQGNRQANSHSSSYSNTNNRNSRQTQFNKPHGQYGSTQSQQQYKPPLNHRQQHSQAMPSIITQPPPPPSTKGHSATSPPPPMAQFPQPPPPFMFAPGLPMMMAPGQPPAPGALHTQRHGQNGAPPPQPWFNAGHLPLNIQPPPPPPPPMQQLATAHPSPPKIPPFNAASMDGIPNSTQFPNQACFNTTGASGNRQQYSGNRRVSMDGQRHDAGGNQQRSTGGNGSRDFSRRGDQHDRRR
ncbi:serine/threonine protein kinase, CMGC, CDC2/CDK subfamily [Batrachochytrium dendrobatidis]|nr:serine/threonine protein kinase, CMGC, CDC2/CDK subfamily [Batrachochytrium dendrobatidis]